MTQEFTHLLLTRFNTAVGFAPLEQRLCDAWLRARLSPFEQYCLPSVAGQQNATFKWLVFIDAESPRWFKEKMESFGALVTPIYVNGILTDEVIVDKISATDLVRAPFLLSTRLDSDDALARNHLDLVQQAFRGQHREFLEFPVGLQSFRGDLYSAYWPSNPFLSLIERVQSVNRFTTVFCVPHDRVRQVGTVRRMVYSPQWLQIIHSANNVSGLRGFPRLSRSHSDFTVLWPDLPPNDSLGTRLRFSAGALAAKASKIVSNIGIASGRS